MFRQRVQGRVREPRAGIVALTALLGWGALACEERDAPPADPGAALTRGIVYFETAVHEVHPGWANLFGYLHRRFDLEVRNAAGTDLHALRGATSDDVMARIFQRLVDRAATVDADRIAVLESQIDRMTAVALHCARIPLPDHWIDVLRAANGAGGYALTHAALAGEWTREQGCAEAADIAALQREQSDALVALIERRDSLSAEFGTPTDLWIEAIAMLDYLGTHPIQPSWIDALLAQQRSDGGWPVSPTAANSNPHPSALALWVLHAHLRPDAKRIRWVP
jgi:hypothetical protein